MVYLCTHIVENLTTIVVALVVSLHDSATNKVRPRMAQIVVGGSFFAIGGGFFAILGGFFRASCFCSKSKTSA